MGHPFLGSFREKANQRPGHPANQGPGHPVPTLWAHYGKSKIRGRGIRRIVHTSRKIGQIRLSRISPYRDRSLCKLLILRSRKSISDRLSGCPGFPVHQCGRSQDGKEGGLPVHPAQLTELRVSRLLVGTTRPCFGPSSIGLISFPESIKPSPVDA